MATKQETIDDILSYPTKKAQEATRPLNERLAEAVAKGDKKATARLNLEAGARSAGVGLFTGIPDLAVAGYNWLANKDVKDLRTRVLESANIPTKASSDEYDLTYNAPEIAVGVYSVGSLLKSLAKGGKALVQNRKFNKWLEEAVDSGDLSKSDLGVIRKYALTGQGSDSPAVAAVMERLRTNPKFSEILTTLEKAATDATLKGMNPAASKLNEPDAAKHAVEALKGKLDDLIQTKNTAGDVQFAKARGYAGDKPIVNTDNTLSSIQRLRKEYEGKGTDSAKAVLKFLDGIEERITPTITAPATKGTTVTQSPVVGDTLMNIPGSKGASFDIPGASGYTTKASPKAFTLDETQSFLREWGKKIGVDNSAISGAGSDDIQRVYKTLFGSLSNDMRLSAKAANAAGDLDTQRALQAAMDGRKAISNGYAAYEAAVAQGVPKWLQGKNINEVSFEDLYGVYNGLNPSQRAIFRGYLGDTGSEALKAIDSKVYQDFIAGATRKLPDGTFGVDPAAVALKWKELSKDKNTVDALSQALGTNAAEFEKRMNSLYAFTRKMEVAQPDKAAGFVEKVAPDVGRTVGATAGYSAKQAVDLTADVWKKMSSGVSDDVFMKMLLTKEGKDFLKTAGMSKGSRNVLQSLEDMNKVDWVKPSFLAAPTAKVMGTGQGELSLPEDLTLPPDLVGDSNTSDLTLPDDLTLPPDLAGENTFNPDSLPEVQKGSWDPSGAPVSEWRKLFPNEADIYGQARGLQGVR